MLFKVQKGKDLPNLGKAAARAVAQLEYLISTKYDGNQIFIVSEGMRKSYYTSGGHQFDMDFFDAKLPDGYYTLVGEMLYDSEGKLGARQVVQGKLTSARVAYTKGLPSGLQQDKVSVKVFDFVDETANTTSYAKRLDRARGVCVWIQELSAVETQLVTGAEAKLIATQLRKEGWEGAMIVEPDSTYHYGKRVNHSIKLKPRPTADLMCIDTELGEGKYADCIGSLKLQDSEGRVVSVGSGLTDADRHYHEDYFVGRIIEISYEQILATYIQPTFIAVRDDKQVSD